MGILPSHFLFISFFIHIFYMKNYNQLDSSPELDQKTLNEITNVWIRKYEELRLITSDEYHILLPEIIKKIRLYCIRYWYCQNQYKEYWSSNNIQYWELAILNQQKTIFASSSVINKKIHRLLVCKEYYPKKYMIMQDILDSNNTDRKTKRLRDEVYNELKNTLNRKLKTTKADVNKENVKKTPTFNVNYDFLVWVDDIRNIDSDVRKQLNLLTNRIKAEKREWSTDNELKEYLIKIDHNWEVQDIAVEYIKYKLEHN